MKHATGGLNVAMPVVTYLVPRGYIKKNLGGIMIRHSEAAQLAVPLAVPQICMGTVPCSSAVPRSSCSSTAVHL